LASALGIPISTLRVQAHRIRGLLRECMEQCLEENAPRL
jgi:DNA-directed RNA polymerase specialized sigma24 family protein